MHFVAKVESVKQMSAHSLHGIGAANDGLRFIKRVGMALSSFCDQNAR